MHRANWTTDVDGAVRRPCPRSQVFGHIWTSAQPPQCRQRRWVAQWLRRSGRGMRHAPAAFSDDHVNHADDMRAMAKSAFFSSDIVFNEFERIMEQFRLLTELQSKWVDFDTAGKDMYLDQMRSFTERLGVYITRCKLSDDPGAKAMIHQLNIGYLNAGLDFNAWHGGWLEKTAVMQTWVDAEKAIPFTDCAAQSAFKAQLRQVFDEAVPDLGWLLNDPQMAECLADPQALSVVNTVFKEPSAASAYKGTRMEPLALKVASMRRRP